MVGSIQNVINTISHVLCYVNPQSIENPRKQQKKPNLITQQRHTHHYNKKARQVIA